MTNKRMEQQLEKIFGPICRSAEDVNIAFAQSRKLRGLPKGLAFYFWQSYGQGGFLSFRKSFELLYEKLVG